VPPESSKSRGESWPVGRSVEFSSTALLAVPANAQVSTCSRAIHDAGIKFRLLEPTLEEKKRRRLAFGFSPLLEAVGLLLLIGMSARLPPLRSEGPETRKVEIVPLVVGSAPIPGITISRRPASISRLALRPLLPKPPIVDLRPRAIEQHPVTLPEEARELLPAPLAAIPLASPASIVPETPGTFAARSSADEFRVQDGAISQPKSSLPKVQTGGFGDLDGLAKGGPGGRRDLVAKLGSFDTANASGASEDSRQQRGTHRVVVDGGFGDGGVSADAAVGAQPSKPAKVQSSGFGDAVAQQSALKVQPTSSPGPPLEPVTILFKPKPVYPEEARQLRLEGEVILNVVFEASGKLRVQRVIQGLGHGMDEAATFAAERILFKPAQREGRPVDYEALVHIIFQLAY
jgi:TonB family protein